MTLFMNASAARRRPTAWPVAGHRLPKSAIRRRIIACLRPARTPVYMHLGGRRGRWIRVVSGDLTLWRMASTPAATVSAAAARRCVRAASTTCLRSAQGERVPERGRRQEPVNGYGGEHRCDLARRRDGHRACQGIEGVRAVGGAGGGGALRDAASAACRRCSAARRVGEVAWNGTSLRTDFKARRDRRPRGLREMNALAG